jgi:hypothetical protein
MFIFFHHWLPSHCKKFLDMVAKSDIILYMNRNHRKTLAAVFANPVSGNIEWRRIKALFKALGCEIIEGSGSRITILHKGRKAAFHRPHPSKDALRYRVSAARDFFKLIGITP